MDHPTATTTATTATTTTTATTNLEDLISPEVRALQELALRGTWRTILEKTQSQPQPNLRYPHEHITQMTFNVIALCKLRRYSEALDLIETSLEDLNSPSYRFESYPHLYPDRVGSMVPFSLRWLHAHLPSLLSRRHHSLDRLYLLLASVRAHPASPAWRRREEFVISTIISYHSAQREFAVCLTLLREMINRNDKNDRNGGDNSVSLLSKYGAVQLQFGDLEGAKATFQRVEQLVVQQGQQQGEVQLTEGRNLVGRNRALVYMVGKDYVSAVREYDECIERDGSDVVAINNKALCLMYLRDLSDSIKVLENSLERVPTVALNETVVMNLCSMYELAYVNHADVKKTLSNWITRLAPDDFDSSCTRV